MEKVQLMHLELRSSLFYSKIEDLPSEIHENEEFLVLYEIDSGQSRNIEPEKELFINSLIFTGKKAKKAGDLSDELLLPAGSYVFVQHRGAMLRREEWLEMAIELQKDCLWERYKPGKLLYIRFLFEDGKPVTQLFRPCA
ncbi:MAG: hypothetical protein LBI12_02140 [Treponema sp.]|jgi:hypothetical protein|nr:hypothetical protein [Treponema sp.]